MSDGIVDDTSNQLINTIVDRDDALRALATAIARAEAAEQRVAELVSANGWQTGQPPQKENDRNMYLTWDGREIAVLGYYGMWEEDGEATWRDEFDDPVDGITHWRPLPLPPTSKEQVYDGEQS